MSQKNSILNNIQKLLLILITVVSLLYIQTILATTLINYSIDSHFLNNNSHTNIFDPQELFTHYFEWIIWTYKYYKILIQQKYYLLVIIISTYSILALITIITIVLACRKINHTFSNINELFGSASWANETEIKKANLQAKKGILLGQAPQGGYLIADGFQHVLLFAPTGSGKGVGFVIPNCLFWHDSLIVHDMKLENYALTSGWRASQGQKIYVWEPSNTKGITHCYNPLEKISSEPGKMIDDIQKIGNLLLPEKDFWNNEARSLFLGITLAILANPTKLKTLGEVRRTLCSDDLIQEIAVMLDCYGKEIHPVGYMNLSAVLQKPDKERGSVISTLLSALELWANPLIDAATASSDFDISKFKSERTTVYVGATPDNVTRLQKLMQIFYQQATELLTTKMPDLKKEPYGVLFMMDEFPTLGKMEQFKSGIAFFRGYRVRLFLIIQDTQQLKGTYEEAGMNTFLSNSTYRITFAANNYDTANLISQLCGNKTIDSVSYSYSSGLENIFKGPSASYSKAQRALLLPQEVIQLPPDEQILLIEATSPIKSKKIRYFLDEMMLSRLLDPTFVPKQKAFNIREYRILLNKTIDKINNDNKDIST
ncbi:MAG: type IV secretory system conjugative DNA transfer family protein [Pseudomonadota bacterium]